MISRIFYPIGQGAFYAERHEAFNVVYDCGNWKQTNLSKKVVNQNFTKKDSLKILFISHLDWDHISLLSTLKDAVNSIDYVILPLLHDDQKIILSNIHRTLNYSSHTITNTPERFFGEKVKIIRIKPFEDNEISNDTLILDNEPAEGGTRNISSGTIIKISNNDYNWCFIPFNIENKHRSQTLENELKKAGFDVNKFKSDPLYTIKNLTTKKEKNSLKKIYDSLEGKINENSLVIYSGPNIDEVEDKFTPYYGFRHSLEFCYSEIYGNVGCIYTGDVDLNKFDITQIYKKYWNMVGTVQIPHHGSQKDFNSQFLNLGFYFCPISFGVENTYGHPSYKVIDDILNKKSEVIKVTEKMDSGYIQILRTDCW